MRYLEAARRRFPQSKHLSNPFYSFYMFYTANSPHPLSVLCELCVRHPPPPYCAAKTKLWRKLRDEIFAIALPYQTDRGYVVYDRLFDIWLSRL